MTGFLQGRERDHFVFVLLEASPVFRVPSFSSISVTTTRQQRHATLKITTFDKNVFPPELLAKTLRGVDDLCNPLHADDLKYFSVFPEFLSDRPNRRNTRDQSSLIDFNSRITTELTGEIMATCTTNPRVNFDPRRRSGFSQNQRTQLAVKLEDIIPLKRNLHSLSLSL